MTVDTVAYAAEIRRQTLKMVHRAGASHVGSALSIVDIIAVLYGNIMNSNPEEEHNPTRDRFILSKGHGCASLYAALAIRGFFPIEALASYGAPDSILMNHVSHHVTGIEFSTGSLGHGLPHAVGRALASKMSAAKRGDAAPGWRTYVLLSDGELAEGSNWEALLFAAHHHLDNLIVLVDYNKLQSLTSVAETLAIEPLAKKVEAFGLACHEVDGHDHSQLTATLSRASQGKPTLIIAHTTKGKGVSFMEGQVAWHYKTPDESQLSVALAELG